MSSTPRCVVTGATGAVGPAVVAAFQQAGFEVRFAGRQTADVTNLEQVRRLIDGADCVVHAAALLHISNPPPELHDRIHRVNVGGTEYVVRAAEESGVRRIVYFSTINVYGSNRPSLLTEDDEPHPDGIYAETKLEGERIVLGARSATVLRLATVYGARVKGNYRRLVRAIARRRFMAIGSGENRRTLVFDRDAAEAAVLAATHPDAAGRIFNVTDLQVHRVREIIEAIAAAAGVAPPRLALPVAPLRLGFRLLRLPHLEKYLEDVAVSGERIARRLGFAPRYGLLSGWRETVAEMRRAGEL